MENSFVNFLNKLCIDMYKIFHCSLNIWIFNISSSENQKLFFMLILYIFPEILLFIADEKRFYWQHKKAPKFIPDYKNIQNLL